MSRFDMLGSWMAGSQLGQQQYAQLAGMAQNEALMRQRQAEEAARREAQAQQFAARQALDQQQFGEQQRMNTATLGRWDQQTAWENQDRAREEAIRQEEQQRLGFMRDWMKERARGAAGGAARAQRGMLPPEAMNAGGMMSGDATAFLPADITGAAPAEPPETQKLMRLIDNADGAGLKAMMPYLDSIEQQRKLTKMVEGIDSHIGSASILKDPNHRAIYQAYRNANDPDGMMRTMNAAMQSMEKQQFEQQRQANAMEIAKFMAQAKGAAGLPQANKTALGAMYGKMAKNLDKKPEQAYSRQKYVEAQSAALMGNILPDGSVVLNAGNINPQGFIDVVHPDGYTEAIAPEEFRRRYSEQGAGSDISQRGILDGPPSETRSDLPPDENTIYEIFRQKHGRNPHQGDIDELDAIERSMNTGG